MGLDRETRERISKYNDLAANKPEVDWKKHIEFLPLEDLLLEINRGGTTVVMATHDPRQVPPGKARFYFLDKGRISTPGIWPGMDMES